MYLRFTVLILAFASTPISASVIHKWVDDQGVTHYSDKAPVAEDVQSTQIELPESDHTGGKSGDDYYSIANQWARIHQESLEREKLRAQAQQAKASQKPAVTNVYVEEKGSNGYALFYRKPYYKKHHYKPKAYNPGYTYRYYQSKYPPGLHPGRKVNTGAVGRTY